MSTVIGGTVQKVPGGFYQLSGGIRTGVRTGWSWQKDPKMEPGKCPFCTKSIPEVLDVGPLTARWRVLNGHLELFGFHRLIIPRDCWEWERLWDLGGEEAILEALNIASLMTQDANHELWLRVHIGGLGGQNQSHLHWQLSPYDDDDASLPPELERERSMPDRLVFQESGLTVSTGGLRAGQCFITPPPADSSFATETFRRGLARTVHRLVALGNQKLRSAEGFPANFHLGFVFTKENRLLLGSYCPVIDHWGPMDILGLILKRKATLATPHEAMAKFLRE